MSQKIEIKIKEIFKKEAALKRHLNKGSTRQKCTFSIERLHGDGSSRQFYRVTVSGKSYISIHSPVNDLSNVNENDSYCYIGKHLKKRGIPVPDIFAYDRARGIIIIEDLGDTHLQSVVDFEHEREQSSACYMKILETLIKMQVEGTQKFDITKCFDTPVYDREFIYHRELLYFKREFLGKYLGLNTEKLEIDKELMQLAESVSHIPNNFFMHRDFQSRNIMVRGSKFYFIDFQGGRLGPPTYDLASLLIDPYVNMPPTMQKKLMDAYFTEMQNHLKTSKVEFEEHYHLTALCRNLQILAAFVFLSLEKKKTFFKKYIDPALEQLIYNFENTDSGKLKNIQHIILDAKDYL